MNKDILLIGHVALERTIRLCENNKDKINEYFSRDFVKSLECLKIKYTDYDLQKYLGEDDYLIECIPSLHWGLWNMKTDLNCGFNINEKTIGTLQETIEVLQFFKEDYFDALSSKTYLLVTSRTNELINPFEDLKIPFKKIGITTKGHAGDLIIDDRIRHISRPKKIK